MSHKSRRSADFMVMGFRYSIIIGSLILGLVGCSETGRGTEISGQSSVGETSEAADSDLEVIRFAYVAWDGFDTLPRQGLAPERYREVAEQFAARYRYRPEWVRVSGFHRLIPTVVEGAADVAVGHISITESRTRRVAFTTPITTNREWIIGTSLEGKMGVAAETSYVDSLDKYYPSADSIVLPAGTTPELMAEAISKNEIHATIMDETIARPLLEVHDDFRKLAEVPESRDYGWVVAKDNVALRNALNQFLTSELLSSKTERDLRDWNEIVQSGRIRMITITGPTTYYLWRGEILGFEYELMKEFAKDHELQLEVVVASNSDVFIDWLSTGKGDVVSSSWTALEQRETSKIAFSKPYMYVYEQLVTGGHPVSTLEDLAGREVAVNPNTSHFQMLQGLDPLLGVHVVPVQGQTTESIVDSVASGVYDVTIADSHILAAIARFDERLTIGYEFEPAQPLAWAIFADHTGLLNRLNEWIGQNYRGYVYNVLRNKYFKNTKRMAKQREYRVRDVELSPYDDALKGIVAPYGFDWRLVTSQMYQESRFNPDALSFVGALGLMQVMPRTAQELGFDPANLTDPVTGMNAGVEYLSWTHERFPSVNPAERMWFALAAYNAGPGHVHDARRLAKKLGADNHVWFDNVEDAMLKLSDPQYYRDATYGYVRGSEPVRYVRSIRDRYHSYLKHLEVVGASDH